MVPRYPVVLASASPRRRELLKELVPEFEVVPADVDEDALTRLDPWVTARELALTKARVVARLRPEALVVGSDTVVAVDSGLEYPVQLAKPRNGEDAVRMLRLLSGREHMVITGVALVRGSVEEVSADTTRVSFKELTEGEVRAYVETGEPMDKAGAYAIQGGAAAFVERTEGSISNVIGLPLELLAKMFAAAGV